MLRVSERTIRAIEKRAMAKVRSRLKRLWQQYLNGELEEDELSLTPEEIDALFSLTRTREERQVLAKVLRLIGS